ncbi:AraC family transcriptional regulator [Mycobacterium sp. shizuoka-1]|uniref:AraC family transcriptional regulator n=1 Tax=Mycobacterium sp. shizuoka-1 TaxID=2039281 RepID=UPI000C062BE8|nr:AraC family transcriptional regulator [Mycobacterium sp. shizuoka-1]GAY16348.1 transcriptional regulator [Mycobacterium sp. shizuoka-1]
MDAISRLLSMTHLGAAVDRRCLLGSTTRMDVAAYPEFRVPFHVLLDGECELQVNATTLQMRPGDVVVIPSGAPHRVITPGGGRRHGTVETTGQAFVTTHSTRGGAPVVDLFCGHYLIDAGAGAVLFRSLPDPLHVSLGPPADGAETLEMLSVMMRAEAQREGNGTGAMLSALATALLTMVLRSASNATTGPASWTAAADPGIAETIERVLDRPGAHWTIDRLCRVAAMSRATFLRRFGQQTGMTVGAFLVRVRVMSAAELLMASDATIAAVAGQVGYQSESAFGRAFRAEVGTTPARFRRNQRRRRADSATAGD